MFRISEENTAEQIPVEIGDYLLIAPRHVCSTVNLWEQFTVIGPDGGTVLASASTIEKEVRKGVKSSGNVEAAAIVGARIAEKAKAAGIDTVAFDRSGFRYHGRVKALADAAREAGLKF